MLTRNDVDIVIVTHQPFPIGMAATNRILSYSKVLSIDYKVKIYIPKPSEVLKHQNNFNYKGVIGDIEFEYLNGYTLWPISSSYLKKIRIIIKGYFNLIIRLSKEKPRIVIIYCPEFWLRLMLLLLRIVIKYRLIIEENEFPKIFKETSNNLWTKIYLSLYRFSNGMMVMTEELFNYYTSIKVNNIFILPMTVDSDRFNIKMSHTKSNYFIYCGGHGGFERDGLLDIVKAFHLFHNEFQNFKLIILGPIDRSNKIVREIMEYLSSNKLSDSILLLGSKPTDEIPNYLINAAGIIMAPPRNFTSGGFPTKLGEFLASGTPVICTKISEIPKYLDSHNSFLVEPGSIVEIYKSMVSIVTDTQKSKQIGSEGRKLAASVFNAKAYRDEIIFFLFGKMN